MDKYKAWISSLTPLEFTNEKSLEQIIYELIPILIEIKSKQDNNATLFDTFLTDLKKKINDIKTSITTSNTEFRNKEEEIKTNISNKESEITLNILNRFTEILDKINNFGNTYFTNNPDVFTKGILDVAFLLTNNDTPYSKWNKEDKGIYDTNVNLVDIVSTPPLDSSGYRYCTSDKQVYYGDHITSDGQINKLVKYKNNVLYKKAYGVLQEKLFPTTENGYFIGFCDINNACYFASSVSGSETTYSIKMINLTTKELTRYENLVMPEGFSNVYLSNNNHYIIKKFNEYYFMFYLKNGESIPYIARSTDLIHWANVGSIGASGLITLRVCNNNLYITTSSFGSYLYDEVNNKFDKVMYDNNEVIIIGEIEENIVFVPTMGGSIYGSIDKNLANATIFKGGTYYATGNVNRLEFSKNENLFTILGEPYQLQYDILSVMYIANHGYPIHNIKFSSLNAFFNIDDKTLYSIYSTRGSFKYYPTKFDTPFIGDIVVNENGDIYDDKYLQKLEIKTEWEYLGR